MACLGHHPQARHSARACPAAGTQSARSSAKRRGRPLVAEDERWRRALIGTERIPHMTQMLSSIPRIDTPIATRGNAPSHSPPDTRYVPANKPARFLGWFSIGLGLTEIFAHQRLAEAI